MNERLIPTAHDEEHRDRLERIIGRVQQSEDGDLLQAIELVLDEHLQQRTISA